MVPTTVIDRERFTATFRMGIWTPLGAVPVYRRVSEIDWPEAVVAEPKKPDPKSGGGRLLEVYVRCAGGREVGVRPMAYSGDTAADVAAEARLVASFLELDYVDRKVADDVRSYGVRPAPLTASLRKEGPPPRRGPPEATRVRVSSAAGRLEFEVPPLRSRPRGAAGLVLAAVVAVGVAVVPPLVPAAAEALGALGRCLLAAGGLTVFGLAGLAMKESIGRSTSRESVSASPDRVTVERRTLFGRSRFEARAEDVLHVGVERLRASAGAPAVVIVESRAAAACFGEALADEEREWLVAAVKRALVAAD
jgi:hypothetical protein